MKKTIKQMLVYSLGFFVLVSWGGCNTPRRKKINNDIYADMPREAEWILNGEPIEFEGTKWYPADGIEILLETEVYPVGMYKQVRFYVDKVDVKPYSRLYTKFDKNKYRFFQKKEKE